MKNKKQIINANGTGLGRESYPTSSSLYRRSTQTQVLNRIRNGGLIGGTSGIIGIDGNSRIGEVRGLYNKCPVALVKQLTKVLKEIKKAKPNLFRYPYIGSCYFFNNTNNFVLPPFELYLNNKNKLKVRIPTKKARGELKALARGLPSSAPSQSPPSRLISEQRARAVERVVREASRQGLDVPEGFPIPPDAPEALRSLGTTPPPPDPLISTISKRLEGDKDTKLVMKVLRYSLAVSVGGHIHFGSSAKDVPMKSSRLKSVMRMALIESFREGTGARGHLPTTSVSRPVMEKMYGNFLLSFTILPLLYPLHSDLSIIARFLKGYGKMNAFRGKDWGGEWRSPPSFIGDPDVMRGVLCIACLVRDFCLDSSLKEVKKTISVKDFVDWSLLLDLRDDSASFSGKCLQGKITYDTIVSKREEAWERIQKLPNFKKYKEEITKFYKMSKTMPKLLTKQSIQEGWGLK